MIFPYFWTEKKHNDKPCTEGHLLWIRTCFIKKCSNCMNNCLEHCLGWWGKTLYVFVLDKKEIDFIATHRTSKIKYNFLSFAHPLIDVGRSMITGSVKCTLNQMKVSPQEAIKHNAKTGFAQLLLDKNMCIKKTGASCHTRRVKLLVFV